MPTRCVWCGNDPLYIDYHDREWGVPLHDERRLFEMLCLEGAQAGLSWLTILKKREGYRQAFANFDIEIVSNFSPAMVTSLTANPAIVRNRLKIASVVNNARVVSEIKNQYGSLDNFLWRYTDGVTIHNSWHSHEQIPTQSDLSVHMSKDLKKLGGKFIGPTICYALMQSIGMVNDHITSCFRYQQLRDSTAV
ncbi:MAG: DNA-3-methyladenine glycosylase I [Desulfuromonas sp.]|nr:DNA-3-methyladenine glycosylase I [Desulfuromonas sp.]